MLEQLKRSRHPYLELLGPNGSGTRFVLDAEIVSIGRSSANTIVLDHPALSQRHCLLVKTAAGVKTVDLESTNGSFVNDRRVLEAVLRDGDILRVGPYRFRFHTAGFVPPPPPLLPGEAAVSRPFADLVMRELRRTPVWLLSLTVHLIAALLLWHAVFLRVPVPRRPAVVTAHTEGAAEPFLPPEPETVVPDTVPPPDLTPAPLTLAEDSPPPRGQASPAAAPALLGPGPGPREPRGLGPGLSGAEALPLGALEGSAFGRHLARLRGQGLDVAVVFDSTGSMQEVIDAVKDRIHNLHAALSMLVGRRYRLAFVTYRDHQDEYLVKLHPFAPQPYGALAFLEGIHAGGGDDVPEAVAAGLEVAVQGLAWRRRAAKALLLIGDAPPHEDEIPRCRQLLDRFRRRGGEAHVLFTAAKGAELDATARRTVALFRSFARRGGGAFFFLDQEADVVRALGSLVFGRRYRKEAEQLAARLDFGWQGRLVTRHVRARDVAWLLGHFRRRPCPHPLIVEGLVAVRAPDLDRTLATLARDPDLAQAQRDAARYVLLRRRRLAR